MAKSPKYRIVQGVGPLGQAIRAKLPISLRKKTTKRGFYRLHMKGFFMLMYCDLVVKKLYGMKK